MNKHEAEKFEECLDGRKLYYALCQFDEEFKDGYKYVLAKNIHEAEDILYDELEYDEDDDDAVQFIGPIYAFDPILGVIDPKWDDHSLFWHAYDFHIDITVKMFKEYQKYKIDQYSLEKEIIEKQLKLNI